MRLPEDVLLIDYAKLAEEPLDRLRRLGLISVLFNRPPDLYTATHLGLNENEWSVLCDWIQQGNIQFFWRVEAQGIHIQHTCEKHIIVDTRLLMTDLRSTFKNIFTTRQPEIDAVWRAARHYVMTAIPLETD